MTAQAQQVLRVTAIPDESPTELARKFAPLGQYLEGRLGMKVEWTPVTDYAAAVETLVNRKVDLAWFGGFTFVQASVRSGGKAVPLVQREEDERFRSVFITDAASGIGKLEDLKGPHAQLRLAVQHLGAPDAAQLPAGREDHIPTSTSSASVSPARTMPPSAAVASGKVDAGALNISVWEKFVAEKKVDPAQVKVFYTTPWLLRLQLDRACRHAGRAGRTSCARPSSSSTPATPQGKEILGLQRATRFIPTKASNYDGIRAAAENAGLLK